MNVWSVEPELASVVSALEGTVGFRSVWLDPRGHVWHSEPELELEHDRWALVGTFLRPSLHDMRCAMDAMVDPGARTCAEPVAFPAVCAV